MFRLSGQKTLSCDSCGKNFDDRPRDKHKLLVAEAQSQGWGVTYADTPQEQHYCNSCVVPVRRSSLLTLIKKFDHGINIPPEKFNRAFDDLRGALTFDDFQ